MSVSILGHKSDARHDVCVTFVALYFKIARCIYGYATAKQACLEAFTSLINLLIVFVYQFSAQAPQMKTD